MKRITCQVESLTSLTEFVYKVMLKPAEKIDFVPGQYLNFVMGEEDKRPFSIASSPNNDLIELQIGASGAESYPMQVIDRIKENATVEVELPLGKYGLISDSERPLLLLAGGTGFSYIKSMFEYLAETGTNREVIVYWGLREPSACYELEKTAETVSKIGNATFNAVVEFPDDNWQGKVGRVHEVAMKDIANFESYDIYLAGRFDMVGAIREDFSKQGALVEHMYADAFAYI